MRFYGMLPIRIKETRTSGGRRHLKMDLCELQEAASDIASLITDCIDLPPQRSPHLLLFDCTVLNGRRMTSVPLAARYQVC